MRDFLNLAIAAAACGGVSVWAYFMSRKYKRK